MILLSNFKISLYYNDDVLKVSFERCYFVLHDNALIFK